MYRPHRGGFNESMKEKQEFPSVDEMLLTLHAYKVEWYSRDERLKADCFIVLHEKGPLGFCWYEDTVGGL